MNGAPTETAVNLMRWGGLSRPGALRFADELGPVWATAAEVLNQDDSFDSHISAFDRNRLFSLRAQLLRDRGNTIA